MKRVILLLLITIILGACEQDEARIAKESLHDLRAKVIYLKDGDSFVVLDSNKNEIEVRLLDIDAPELHQAFGKKAKMYLSNLIKGKNVYIDLEEMDRYGRILADVYLDSVHVNYHMVEAGYAWHFTRYSKDLEFSIAEDLARQKKKGLWKGGKPEAPWEWRKHRK